jgi:hypothetical protein
MPIELVECSGGGGSRTGLATRGVALDAALQADPARRPELGDLVKSLAKLR